MNREAWRQQVLEDAVEPELPIIDAHHHIWRDSPAPGYEAYDGEAILRDKMGSGHNVVATVYVDSHANYLDHGPIDLRVVGETSFAQSLAEDAQMRGGKAAGLCAAIVPHTDLTRGQAAGEVLDAHLAASPRMRGVRHMAAFDTELPPIYGADRPGVYMEKGFRKGFAELAPRGLSFDAWVFHPQLAEIVDLARAFPETTIILDHLGGPIGIGKYQDETQGFDTWRRGMAAAAACPNVVLKLGSLSMSYSRLDATDAPRPMTSDEMAQRWRRHVRTAVDLFEPSRCMFESNFPVDMVSTSYVVLWNSFKKLTADLSELQRAEMFDGVARRTYRI